MNTLLQHPEEAGERNHHRENDETGAQSEEAQVRMMKEIAKLTAGSTGKIEADFNAQKIRCRQVVLIRLFASLKAHGHL
jgi:hypothetical protein